MAELRYPFVLFDAGETLIGPRESFGQVYSRVLRTLGVDAEPGVLDCALRATWEELGREIPPGTDRYAHFPGGEGAYWLGFVRRTLRRVPGLADPEGLTTCALEGLRDAFRDRDAWQVYPDVRPTLDSLRALGARLAVVSNWDSRLPALLERLGLARYFDAIVVSHLEGVEKPHPELFRRALERLGAAPGAALHVGDVPELDVDGAAAAGVQAVLVDRRGLLAPETGALRDLGLLPVIVRGGTR